MGLPELFEKGGEILGLSPLLVLAITAICIIIGYSYKLFRDNQAYNKDKLETLLTLVKEHQDLLGSDLKIYHDAIAATSFALVTRIKHVRTVEQRDGWLALHKANPKKNTLERLASASELIGAKGADPIEKIPCGLHIAAWAMIAVCTILVVAIAALLRLAQLSIEKLQPVEQVMQYSLLAAVYAAALLLAFYGIVGPYICAGLAHREYRNAEKAKCRSEPAPH